MAGERIVIVLGHPVGASLPAAGSIQW
jgi:hypothetical protein